jgi:hypothetical protein
MPGDSSLVVEELAIGDWLANVSGNVKLTRSPAVAAGRSESGARGRRPHARHVDGHRSGTLPPSVRSLRS